MTGPSPVPYKVTTWPSFALTVGVLIGWLLADTKFSMAPGPRPVPSAVKIPKALLVIRTGDMLLRPLLWIT